MSLSHHPNIVRNGLVAYFDAANPKSYPAKDDPYVGNVSLLLDFDGVNGSTTFIDKSLNNISITAIGNSSITSFSKFGSGAGYFDGNGDYLEMNNSNLAMGTSSFTIEMWVYFLDLPPSGQYRGLCNTSGQGYTTWWFALENTTGTIRLRLGRHGDGAVYGYTNWTPSLNTWYHVAATKDGNNIYLFINGISQSVTNSNNWSTRDFSTTLFRVGMTDTVQSLYGYIDDLRLTKAARYTASFTPPTAPLSLPGRITDLTTNKAIGTLTNGPTYSGGSLVFDGTNDYMTSPTSTLFNFATGDFTIEMWVYPTSVKTFSLLDFRINETNPNGNAFVIGTSASNLWVVYQNGNQITGPTVVANQWTQVVVNRVGTAVKMFLNGTQIGSTWTTSNSFTDGAFVLGTDYPLNARFFQGNLSSVKIYKGKGLSNNEILQNYNATKSRYGY